MYKKNRNNAEVHNWESGSQPELKEIQEKNAIPDFSPKHETVNCQKRISNVIGNQIFFF